MIDIKNKELCCGCGVCYDICPVKCISMVDDGEGFKYPKIDKNMCIKCGACNNVCPIESGKTVNKEAINAYAVWNKDEEIRLDSTSGGVFTALAETVISQGGIVIGAQYNESRLVNHISIDTKEEIGRLRQSKYVQSDTNGIYKIVKQKLSSNKPILFCGTPCQTEALVRYLKGKPENLILCDFICRGISSPKVYSDYLSYLEERYKAKIKKVQFKNKRYGWHRFSTKISFQNGKEYIKDRYHDSYMLLYLRENITIRPSCYKCRFKGVDRCSDITLGDFWGVDEKHLDYDNDKGTSAVIVNTDIGQKLLSSSENQLEIHPVELADIIKGNPCIMNSPVCERDRDKFYEQLQLKGYSYIVKKYCSTFFDDMKKGIRNVLRGVKKR